MNTPKMRVVFFIFLAIAIIILAVFAYFYYGFKEPTMQTTNIPAHNPLSAEDTKDLLAIIGAAQKTPTQGESSAKSYPVRDLSSEPKTVQQAVIGITASTTSPKELTPVEASFLKGIIGAQ